jgi:hypothetical protein
VPSRVPDASPTAGKSVALLGESPVHGFGKTLEFKVELVRRLIQGVLHREWNLRFPEHSEKAQLRQEVTEQMISAAIGALWASARARKNLKQRVRTATSEPSGTDTYS